MSDVVIVGLLSLLGTLGGTFGGILASNRLTTYRLEQLEKKVDKHNSLVERMYCTETRLDVLGEQVKAADRRIDAIAVFQE
jgi:hypothetical protein